MATHRRVGTKTEENIVSGLKYARIQKGLTQQQVADKLGVFQLTISYWETGQRFPKFRQLEQWAAALGKYIFVDIVDK